MKRNFIVYLSVSIWFIACSSGESEFEIKESEVPPNVLEAFKSKYPSARVTKWEAEKEDGKFYFEAEVIDSGKEKEILITPDGKVTEED